MNGDDDSWTEDREPADDERVLHASPPLGWSGGEPTDYAAAITTDETAWWAALSDYEYAYAVLRALEQASARGAPLQLARCAHHLQDLLRGLDPPDCTWVLTLVRRIGELLARRAARDGAVVTVADLLADLAGVATDARFAPPSVLPLGLLHRMFPHGAGPEDLQEALDRQRYPHGKPLPVCPLCEPERADPAAPLTRTIAALPAAQHEILGRVGQALALAGHAPDLADQVAWVTGTRPVPAVYQALLQLADAFHALRVHPDRWHSVPQQPRRAARPASAHCSCLCQRWPPRSLRWPAERGAVCAFVRRGPPVALGT